ncbi:MAG: ABC transporter ATP-binding protein [Planctomycetota bacterium]|nr:ABC transporter ATP-binding protein [Planctomycetota bacterium]
MSLTFDRVVARRTLIGVNHSEIAPLKDVSACTQRLIESAASFRMRIDAIDLDLKQAAALIRPRCPLGLLWKDETGKLAWLLLVDHRGNRIHVLESSRSNRPRWLSVRKLATQLNSLAETTYWLSLQASFPCESSRGSDGQRPTPLSRYISLLAPERSDIGVILVFALFIGVLALSTPIAIEALVNTVAFGQFLQPVIVLALILFVFLSFAAAMRAVQAYVTEIIQRRLFVRVAADLAHRLPRVKAEFWRTHYGPEIVNRFFDTVTVQKVTAQFLLDGTALVLQTLVGMSVIAFYHPVLLGFNAFLLTMMGLIVFVLGRKAVTTSTEESRQKYATAGWLEELARHPSLFRSRGGLGFALDRADQFVTGYLSARSEHFHIVMRQICAALALQAVASTVLLGLGGWLVIRGDLTLGQLVAAELIVTLIVGSFAKIGKQLEGYYDVMAAMDKLGHLFDMPVERLEGCELPRSIEGLSVSLHDLALEPLPGGQTIKRGNLFVQPGQQLALVGMPAGLRSQVLQAIAGLRAPLSGHVELDGNDIRRIWLESLRDQIAFVGEVEVFAGTIFENLHVGRTHVGEDDIKHALQRVGLLDDVLDLPQGLESYLQTDGREFCMDQLVRLMLARALAGCPRLVLVDELLDRLSDDGLLQAMAGLAESGFSTTMIVSTGRRDVAAHFERHVLVATDGTLGPNPDENGTPTIVSPHERRLAQDNE